MTIHEERAFYNSAYKSKILDSEKGNIPNIWYHKIISESDKQDNLAIGILSELLGLYLQSNPHTRGFQIAYLQLSTKFNYSRRQLYNAIVRLEEKDLIQRRRATIEVDGQPLGNFLFLTLNIEELFQICTETGKNRGADYGS